MQIEIHKLSLNWNLMQCPINPHFKDEERDTEHLSQVWKAPSGPCAGQVSRSWVWNISYLDFFLRVNEMPILEILASNAMGP